MYYQTTTKKSIMKNLNFASVTILGAIFGSFATATYSTIGTTFEPLAGLWFVFSLLSGVLAVVFIIYSEFGDILNYHNKQRFFAVILAIASAVAPYLLWVNQIIIFN